MSNKRFVSECEIGGDWCVVDTQRSRMTVATGLSEDEAKEGAYNRNKEYEADLQKGS